MDELKERIRDLMLANVSDGHSWLLGADYCYVQPSPDTYPFQFWWDTCLNVIILCHLKEHGLARRNLQSLFAMQEANGFVGHMVFWKKTLPTHLSDVLQARPSLRAIRPHMSALIQPPLAAHALARLHACTGDDGFLLEMLPALIRYFEWLARERDFDGGGLLTTISPFESGLDFKPSYDPVLGYRKGRAGLGLLWRALRVDASNFLRRYDLGSIRRSGRFRVRDVLVNSFYALDLLELSRLCRIAGFEQAGTLYATRADKVMAAIQDKMYDPGLEAYLDLDEHGQRIPALTFTLFAPLMLPGLPQAQVARIVSRHLRDPEEFAVPYPAPSLAADEPAFNPREDGRYLWRGPTWAVGNWCLWRGLREYGFHEDAARLTRSMQDLVQRSGFREYYDPFSGQGYGARDFTWSGLVLDMQAAESVPAPPPHKARNTAPPEGPILGA